MPFFRGENRILLLKQRKERNKKNNKAKRKQTKKV